MERSTGWQKVMRRTRSIVVECSLVVRGVPSSNPPPQKKTISKILQRPQVRTVTRSRAAFPMGTHEALRVHAFKQCIHNHHSAALE